MSVEVYPVKIIGHIRTDFTSKFGVPRQSGIVDALEARIEFEKEFAQGQYKSGCVCHPFAVSSQRHRAFFGKN